MQYSLKDKLRVSVSKHEIHVQPLFVPKRETRILLQKYETRVQPKAMPHVPLIKRDFHVPLLKGESHI